MAKENAVLIRNFVQDLLECSISWMRVELKPVLDYNSKYNTDWNNTDGPAFITRKNFIKG